MTQSKIELSIIIPSFNTEKLTLACLESIFKETKKTRFEVIVVDNASLDKTVKKIKEKFPQVKTVENKENQGYAKANNEGIKIAQGEYILFLNSDTLILDKAIEKSLDFMKSRAGVDILGCQLKNADGTIQSSGGYFPKLRRVFYQMFFIDDLPIINTLLKSYQENRRGFYKKTRSLDWVTGAFIMFKKNVLSEIKGFDESFFMYSEEVDLCFRAKKIGFKIWFYPQAKVIHYKGGNDPQGFERAVLGEYQGLIKFYQKLRPLWELPILKVLLKIGALTRIVLFGILEKDQNRRKVYEKAFKVV